MAAVLCMGAPLSSTLIAGVASLRLQRAAAAVGAVVPGWQAIEQLGGIDTLQIDADDLFTADSAQLEDIRIFKGGRIDRAILYAASVLNQSCAALRGLFRQIIEDRTDILYPIKDLEVHRGLGFAAWCDNNRVLIGNRAYMEREGVPLPELEYEQNYGTDITALYESAGATVLNYEYKDITINSQPLRIGGIYGYCLPDKYLETGEADPGECKFLWDFENTDRYKILLSHLPIAWLKNDGLEEWDIDCVFSGHLHGGQVILPGIGGVYAPDMGWFPGQLKGIFDSEDGKRHLVLSSGLGNTELVPRFNNIPEIVCVELIPDGNLHKT